MKSHISQHLRRNAPVYILILAVLATGTALAEALAPDSVKSKHIVDGTIEGRDVGANALTGADVNERKLSHPGFVKTFTQDALGLATTRPIVKKSGLTLRSYCERQGGGSSWALQAKTARVGNIDVFGVEADDDDTDGSGQILYSLETPTPGKNGPGFENVLIVAVDPKGFGFAQGDLLWTRPSGPGLKMRFSLDLPSTLALCRVRTLISTVPAP